MIWKCANPECSVAFVHRQGRLFRFPKRPIEDSRPANTHSVQHFWLCADCSEANSLEYDEGLGVALIHRLERSPAPKLRQIIAEA
jgi:hypothetical protein